MSASEPVGLTVPGSVLRNYPADYPGDFPQSPQIQATAAGFDVIARIPPQVDAAVFHRAQSRVVSRPSKARMVVNLFPIVTAGTDPKVHASAVVLSKTQLKCAEKTSATLGNGISLCSNMELGDEVIQAVNSMLGPDEIYQTYKFLYFIAPVQNVSLTGPSWQLAAALTLRLLPSCWALTGSVTPQTNILGQVDHLSLKAETLKQFGLGLMTTFVHDGQAASDLHGHEFIPSDLELARLRLGHLGDLSSLVNIETVDEAALMALATHIPELKQETQKPAPKGSAPKNIQRPRPVRARKPKGRGQRRTPKAPARINLRVPTRRGERVPRPKGKVTKLDQMLDSMTLKDMKFENAMQNSENPQETYDEWLSRGYLPPDKYNRLFDKSPYAHY